MVLYEHRVGFAVIVGIGLALASVVLKVVWTEIVYGVDMDYGHVNRILDSFSMKSMVC